MKVEIIKAYKSEDNNIWEKEADAINSNIEDLIIENLHHRCHDSESNINHDILKWFRDHPKDIKYIQTNIKNLLPEHFGEEE